MKKSLLFTLVFSIIILAPAVLGAYGYEYVSNIDPHTRYNPQREDCYYYYGYGSCAVAKVHCAGVPVGKDKWIDLGDACKRNAPPTIGSAFDDKNASTNEPPKDSKVIVVNTIRDIVVKEGQKVDIDVRCVDEDPVEISYSGWTTTKITQTDYNDAGTYDQKIICTDSFNERAEANIKIIITDQNRPPLFRLIDFLKTAPKANFTMSK